MPPQDRKANRLPILGRAVQNPVTIPNLVWARLEKKCAMKHRLWKNHTFNRSTSAG